MRALPILTLFDRRTGTEQISVAINIVDPAYSRPEFVFARPRRGKSRLFARVRMVPLFGSNLPRSVRRVLQAYCFRDPSFRSATALHLRVDRRSSRRKNGRARCFGSLSVGSIIMVPATGQETVGA